ncbi:MAG TPA: hypothetical protein VNT75_13380 [Symbiobacteriaceae bacterium]|nr:hypothetical protein [Symbiobacteriaceae bacterium]
MLVRVAGVALLAAAALGLMVWGSYPDLVGVAMAPLWLRVLEYGAVTAAGLAFARWLFRKDGATRLFWGVLLGVFLLMAWWITFEATYALDARHVGRLAGDEGLLVAGVWGAYGLALALGGRRFSHLYVRQAARLAIGAGLAFLVVGAIMSNARWADPGYRVFAYAATVGSAWLAEALFSRYGDDGDVQGLVSLTGALAGAVVVAFETRLWLDRHLFTFDVGMLQSAAHVAREVSTRAYATAAGWGVWALGTGLAGVWLRSGRTRLLAAGMFAVALGYSLWTAQVPGAPLGLAVAAVGISAGGAVLLSWLARRVPGKRDEREILLFRWLPWGVGAAALVWLVLKLIG